MVLQTNNKVMMFLNDQPLKTIDIDLSSISLVDVTAQEKVANEVDDTFGFGNIIEDAIKDKIFQNQKKDSKGDGRRDDDTDSRGTGTGNMSGHKEKYFVTAISPTGGGFLLGVSGGL